jgi:hypothetical protein
VVVVVTDCVKLGVPVLVGVSDIVVVLVGVFVGVGVLVGVTVAVTVIVGVIPVEYIDDVISHSGQSDGKLGETLGV